MKTGKEMSQRELAEDVQSANDTNHKQGKILRVKQGYNPNSSSIGSIIFVLPTALLGVTAGFGAVSGAIMAALMTGKARDNAGASTPEEGETNE